MSQPHSRVASPFPPYSFQKRPEPQICPKFVPAIVFGGSSQGDWTLSKICQNLFENCRFSNFDKFLTNSSPPDWNAQKQSPGQILDKFGVRGVFESCKGEKGSQLARGIPGKTLRSGILPELLPASPSRTGVWPTNVCLLLVTRNPNVLGFPSLA